MNVAEYRLAGAVGATAGAIARMSIALLWILVAVGMVGGAPRASADTFLERAQAYFDQGDVKSAAVELKNALQEDPNNAEARFLLGKVHLKRGDPLSAEKELLRAQELGYAGEELKLMLAYARLNQGQYDTVISDIGDSNAGQSPLQRDLHVARGEALMGLGKFDEAEQIFDHILQDGPHVRALVNKARIAMVKGDTGAARRWLDQAAGIHAEDPHLIAVDAAWYYQERQFEKAKERFAEAAKLDPTQLENHIGKIQSLLALGELEQAEENTENLKKAARGNLAVTLLDGLVQFQRARYQEALTAAESVLGVAKDHPQALLLAGLSAYKVAQFEKARVYVGSYLAQNPQDDQARMVLGATMLSLGYPKEAYGTLTALAGGDAPDDSDYLSLLASAAIGMGDRDASVKYLQQLAQKQPEDAAVQERLGVALQSQGDSAGAEAALEKSISLEPDRLSAHTRLFAVQLGQKQIDKALETARQIQSRAPDKAVGDTLMGVAYLAKRDVNQARQAFETALKKEPANAEAAGNLANLMVMEGQAEEARKVLDGVLQANPKHLRTLMAAAELASRAGDGSKAEELWRRAVEANPDAKQPRISLASFYMKGNRPAEALAVTEPALVRSPQSLGLLESVGQARLRTGDAIGALEAFRTLAALVPDSYPAQEWLMRALELNGRIPEALTAAENTLRLDPKNLQARVGQVRYLAQLGRLEDAQARLQPLKEEFPDQVEVLLLDGRITLLSKRGDEAVSILRRAFELYRGNSTLIELSRALFATNKGDEALALLHGWLDEYPNDVLTRITLAEAQIGLGELAEAERQYESILAATPNNARALNNLAWIRATLGKPAEAVDLARKAHGLAPNSPSVADTLAVILLDTGKAQEAMQLLQSARQAAPDSPAIQFHFARALAANGLNEAAVAELRTLLKGDRVFSERQQAEALLAELSKR
jgi:putative PEP-CTERM system TPR-repeat lipoprotein